MKGSGEMNETITYPIVCPSCEGKGWISSPPSIASSATRVCPACNGDKVVTLTREVANE